MLFQFYLMITRIVKMVFKPDEVVTFLQVFDDSKLKIRAFEGCKHLKLLRDKNRPNIFFTYSKWNAESDLENYRNSALFIGTWAKTKVLFADKPEAWTVNVEWESAD